MPNATIVFLSEDIAKLIDRSAATVRKEAHLQRLVPSMRTPRGVRVYSAADVGKYLDERQRRRGSGGAQSA
jgi:hypothetical protein